MRGGVRGLVLPPGGGATGGGITNINISAGTTNQNLSNVSFGNANGVSFGINGSTITGSIAAGVQTGISGIIVSDATFTSGTVSFGNLNGISFGSNGVNQLTASYTVPNVPAQTAFVLSNSNGISFGTNGSTVTATVKTDYQSAGAYLTTAAQSNQVVNSINGDTGTFSFNTGSSLSSSRVGNAITFGLASNITTALQPAGAYLTTAAQSNQVVNSINGDTGTFSFNTGSSLSSSRVGNAITFGLASNISTALQSAGAYLTTAMLSNAVTLSNIRLSAGTTSNLASAFTFADGSGISFGLNAGTITGTVKTAYAGFGTSATNASITMNSDGLAISVAAPGAGGSINFSAGTTSSNLTQFKFGDSNGISFGLGALSVLTATVKTDYLTSQSNQAFSADASSTFQTLSFQNTSNVSFSNNAGAIRIQHNLAGTGTAITGNASITLNSTGLSFNGSGIAGTSTGFGGTNISGSMTLNSAGLNMSMSVAAPGAGGSINFSAGTTSSNLTQLKFGDGSGISFGMGALSVLTGTVKTAYLGLGTAQTNVTWSANSDGISLNAAGYAGTSTGFGGTNISGSMTNNSLGLNLSLSVAAAGGAANRSFYDNLGPANTIQAGLGTKVVQFGTLIFFPLEPFNGLFDGNMTFNTLAVDLSISGSTATLSGALSSSIRFGIYTVNTTAATLSLGLLNSVIMSWGYAGAATNNSTGWQGQRYLTAHSSQWSSQPVFSNGVRYVVGMVINSAGASSAQSNTMLGIFQGSTAARSGFLGQSSAATWMGGGGQFFGNYGTATTGLPAGVNFTQINRQVASGNFIPHVIAHVYTNLTMF